MTRVGEDCYFLWIKWNWLIPWIGSDLQEKFRKTLKRRWKTIKTIFDPIAKENKNIDESTYWEYKFLPEWFQTPWVVDIFGDYVVTFNPAWIWNFWEKWVIFVMINKELADSYRTWFKFIWEHCED
jgi:hypothetical protein